MPSSGNCNNRIYDFAQIKLAERSRSRSQLYLSEVEVAERSRRNGIEGS